MPLIPLPPRFWLLKVSLLIRLIYPSFVMVMTTSSFGIRSSMEMSYSSNPMEVLLSSPYFSEMTRISFRITPRRSFLSARIALYSAIFFMSSSYSASSFSLSSPVRALKRMSTIACACASLRLNSFMRDSFAICTVLEPRMIVITRSILSRAISKPSKIWARSSALFRSYLVLLVTTSS